MAWLGNVSICGRDKATYPFVTRELDEDLCPMACIYVIARREFDDYGVANRHIVLGVDESSALTGRVPLSAIQRRNEADCVLVMRERDRARRITIVNDIGLAFLTPFDRKI